MVILNPSLSVEPDDFMLRTVALKVGMSTGETLKLLVVTRGSLTGTEPVAAGTAADVAGPTEM